MCIYGVINLIDQSAGTDPTDSQPKLSQMMGGRPDLSGPSFFSCPVRRAVVPVRSTETRGIDLAYLGACQEQQQPRSGQGARPLLQVVVAVVVLLMVLGVSEWWGR